MKILDNAFFERSPLEVAPDLIGKILVRKYNDQIISGSIIEVEAYLAITDSASHSFKGKTQRNQSLFGDAGRTYIHSIHQQHCIDIVTQGVGIPSSVLIRALERIDGIDLMKKFRGLEHLKDLTSGPGKLCSALNITKELNGINVTDENSQITLFADGCKFLNIVKGKRIGITKSTELEYRYYVNNNPFLSRKKG